MPTTAHVLQQAQQGDEAAFAQLVTPYRRELHVHCYRMLGSFDDAEDALQDVLLAAWRGDRWVPRPSVAPDLALPPGDALRAATSAGDVRVAVVPGHEVGGAVGAVQLDARDVAVPRRAIGAGGEDDGVVERAAGRRASGRCRSRRSRAGGCRRARGPCTRRDDLLDARVVGRDAVAAPGRTGRAGARTGRC